MNTFLAVSLLISSAGCADSGDAPLVAEEILQLNSEANQVVLGLEHFMTESGVRRARVLADTAFFLEDKALVELKQMEVWFYNTNGQITSTLTAREGTYDWNTGNMTAKNDVIVINPQEERTIETSIMYYDRAMDRIWGDAPTKMIEKDGTIVEGTAFETDSRMDNVDLTSARMVRPGGGGSI